MDKFFNPGSMVIFGVTDKKRSIPRYILENTLRWGYNGRIYGVTPGHGGNSVKGVPVFDSMEDLPEVPDLAVLLIPAGMVPAVLEKCGKLGIKRAAILSGGFNESGESGASLAEEIQKIADRYGIRFLGPNGLTVADAGSGVCLPFIPHVKMKKGGFSFLSQSGGFLLVLWNQMHDENMGMSKFVSIGNKLNVDESDLLEYMGSDPETEVIGLYLESIKNGEKLIEVARKIDKPIIAIKGNRSEAGSRTAMSHTASMSNDDDIVNAAFESAGIIRVDDIQDLITAAGAFRLPPMRGNRLMVMTPGGGSAVMMADIAEKYGFEFADPGKEFYESLNQYTNAGSIIKFSNPLDMGDIYNIHVYPEIIGSALRNSNVDGAVYGHAWPLLPEDDDSIFKTMFHSDISRETIDMIESVGKPLAVSMSATSNTLTKMKHNLPYPVYGRAEDGIRALRIQSDYYANRERRSRTVSEPEGFSFVEISASLKGKEGDTGEDMLESIKGAGIRSPESTVVKNTDEAVKAAAEIGFPVVMKLVSPDVLHKSDAGGVVTGIESESDMKKAYNSIIEGVNKYNPEARIEGVRVSAMASEGHDMFVGGMRDESFGPVVAFGYGGVYTEIFEDIERIICPATEDEIIKKMEKLKSFKILQGARGGIKGDIKAFVDVIRRVSWLMKSFPQISELDLNPVRVMPEGKGAIALDARAYISPEKDSSFSSE